MQEPISLSNTVLDSEVPEEFWTSRKSQTEQVFDVSNDASSVESSEDQGPSESFHSTIAR